MISRLRAFGLRRTLVIVLAVGLVGGVAVPAILAAKDPLPIGPAADVDAATRLGGLGRILRADATVLRRDGTTMAVHYERGEIAAVGSASITVKGLDGVSTTFGVSAATHVRERRKEVAVTDLVVGERAMVFGTKNASGGLDAVLIRCITRSAPGLAAPTPSPTR